MRQEGFNKPAGDDAVRRSTSILRKRIDSEPGPAAFTDTGRDRPKRDHD
jgi:hypothetical protein